MLATSGREFALAALQCAPLYQAVTRRKCIDTWASVHNYMMGAGFVAGRAEVTALCLKALYAFSGQVDRAGMRLSVGPRRIEEVFR
jgi:hypothetical protein